MPTPSPKVKNKDKKAKFSKAQLTKTILLLSPLIIVFALFAAYNFYFSEKIYPGVKIAGIDVGSKTKNEAFEELKKQVSKPEKILVSAKDKDFDLSLPDVGFSYNIDKSIEDAYLIHRDLPLPQKYIQPVLSIGKEINVDLKVKLNSEKLEEYVQVISSEVAKEPVQPSVKLEGKNITIDKGAPGEFPHIQEFKNNLITNLSNKNFGAISLNFSQDDSSLTPEEEQALYARALNLMGKNIILENEYDIFTLKEKEIFSFLNGKGNYNEKSLANYLSSQIEPNVNREPQNAVFKFEEGRVLEFKPAKSGLTVNKEVLEEQIVSKLASLENTETKSESIKIPVESKNPEITTDKVNDLGIKELLGRGTSKFVGSIPGRMHNISLASSKFNGVLIEPGAEFSFNNTLGDVSTFTGYKQAYVIRDGRTVLGDGGGVCQVSSTLFRALLSAGLPISERRAHSYRVGYYEQDVGPGLDATVFSPTTDLKFKNDTPGHLLIQTQYDGKNASLAFEIYGTSDGRVATTTKPVMLSQTKPPDDVYIDDPSLPTGQVKQVEHRAWGAKVSFDHKVERNGEVIFQKTFLSAYRPWGAVFMKGTGPAQ